MFHSRATCLEEKQLQQDVLENAMNLGRLGKLDDLQMRAYVQHIPPQKKRQTTGNTTKQKFIVFDVFAENFGNGK